MPRSLFLCGWTLAVALGAFAVGRWSIDQPSADSSTSPLVTDKMAADTYLGFSPDKPVAAAAPLSQVRNKPVVGNQGKSSYAMDYQLMQQLIALAASNPQAAMEQAQQLKGSLRDKAQTAILEVWGGLDANAAWNWVQSFQPQNRAQFIHLLEVIGRSDPRTAVAFAEKFAVEHRELRKDIYLAAITGITQAGAYGLALDVVERLDIEAETKTELMSFVVNLWSSYEPQAAMQWVIKQPEEFKAAAINTMGESWATADPAAAVHFAASLGNGAGRDSLLLPSFKQWLATDSAAATSWLAAAPPQKDFDSLISELASQPSLNNGQVKEALTWAGKVQDAELRLSTVTSILSAFKQKDPSAAAAYLQELSFLSETERQQLMEDLAFTR